MNGIYQQISKNYEILSNTEQEVVDYLIRCEDLECLKLKQVQEALFVSSSTVMRACKKLNYQSFTELRYDLIHQRKEVKKKEKKGNLQEKKEQLANDILQTITLLTEDKVISFAQSLLEARRVFCIGQGTSANVMMEFNRKLKLIDKWTNEYYEKYSIERVGELATKKDVILIFSLSGECSEYNEMLLSVKTKGAKVLSITGISNNPLSQISDEHLFVYHSNQMRERLRSRLMLHVAADIVFEEMMSMLSE
ncbi:MAG: MurR/RpiR family transcriptional regulator [Lactobacillales bacterium]|jgi:DNA-binding MurR/RpiR family transcriptional regulator|nr:MurR/RpiR family transcriptional regulator [Lactobacillales bacterium]